MTSCLIIAASLLRFLDPFTSVYQTDDAAEGAALASEPGYWPVPQGLVDPCAQWGKWRPRIVHTVFRVRDEPFPKYDPEKPSPLFKVNQVGYLPDAPKFAYAGAWLGPVLGAWRPKAPMTAWELVDAGTGNVVLRRDGDAAPRVRVRDKVGKDGTLFTGEETYEMDFSSVTNEGTYFVRIPAVGRSSAFRVHMGGLYQKRCGIAKEEPCTHWTAGACHTNVVRGTFAPEEGKLSESVRWFDIIRHNTDWDHGERLHIVGGWHDAADYDRRPKHLNIGGSKRQRLFGRHDDLQVLPVVVVGKTAAGLGVTVDIGQIGFDIVDGGAVHQICSHHLYRHLLGIDSSNAHRRQS